MRLAAPIFLGLLLGCGGQPASEEDYASTEIYYFEVVCLNNGPHCQQTKRVLDAEIPRYKYTFTQASSNAWPYYKAFDLDADVPLDSLIPPHTQLHQLVPLENRPLFGGGNHLVTIELYSIADSIADYNVSIYRLEKSGTILSATSGLHRAQHESGNSIPIPETILKSVIRYSFK